MHKKSRICLALLGILLLLSIAACGNSSLSEAEPDSAASKADPSSSLVETVPQDTQTPAEPSQTEIILSFDDTKVTAWLDDSGTSRAFLERLPMTLTMNRYGDREYYAAIDALPENGEAIPDYENGDITYYTTGSSLAIFFGNAENSSQSGLIRMGKITSDLSLFETIADTSTVTISRAEREESMMGYDFSQFTNVEITGVDMQTLTEEQLSVLYRQARYCQAMTEADTDTMAQLVAENVVFTHMSGRQQTREEYFADIENGELCYFTIGIEDPVIEVNGNTASITYTSVLNADAYGAQGIYRMPGTHRFTYIDGEWMSTSNGNLDE